MLPQDFGPIRLVLPPASTANYWRKFLIIINERQESESDPVAALQLRASMAAVCAAALSADVDSEGKPQTWGDLARGGDPTVVHQDVVMIAAALSGLEAKGVSWAQIAALGDEIVSWLTEEILAPVEAGEKTSAFFARRKAG